MVYWDGGRVDIFSSLGFEGFKKLKFGTFTWNCSRRWVLNILLSPKTSPKLTCTEKWEIICTSAGTNMAAIRKSNFPRKT